MAMRDRVIRDEIHKDILVPARHATIIDTKEFQRLRNIQQLSTCEYVFPAANHNRFAHSLGAYHLAGQLTASLQEVQPGILSDEDAELVQLAALLHDIGHPPFSHVLETPDVYATYHSHEHWGRVLLESSETEVGAAVTNVLGEARTERLFALMDGASEHAGEAIPPFMKEIVSSQLDVGITWSVIKPTQAHKLVVLTSLEFCALFVWAMTGISSSNRGVFPPLKLIW